MLYMTREDAEDFGLDPKNLPATVIIQTREELDARIAALI